MPIMNTSSANNSTSSVDNTSSVEVKNTPLSSKKTHIVILGAGFGGVYTYKSLPRWIKDTCDITLVDKNNHFLFTPLLAEVAGSSLDQHSVVEPIRDIVDGRRHRFIQSTVVSVDTKNKTVTLPDQELSYDILVSSLGSKTHYFGTPGAEEHAFILKDLDNAVSLRNRFIDSFEAAAQIDDPEKRKKILTFMIIGAGPTGVELAGEVADLFFTTFKAQFSPELIQDTQLLLVNSREDVLSMFDKKLQSYASHSLAKDNVTLIKNTRVAEVTEQGVITADGETIDAATVVWCAGVTANSLTCTADAFTSERGRIHVDEKMQAKNTSQVFIVGDMSLFPTEDGRGLPMTAQIAKQQGVATGKNIARLIQGKPLENFKYQEKGLLASLGSFDAVAQVGPLKIKGVVAWFMWRTIYLFNFASWKKRIRIMGEWTIGLFTRRETTRL